tara:strand:+ start:6115 stop:7113 length:999 start_codon:yes stop_codon:yes gene_type:complete
MLDILTDADFVRWQGTTPLSIIGSEEAAVQRGRDQRTIRRNIAELIEKGIVLDKTTASGARFAKRTRGGGYLVSGLDLSPLLDMLGHLQALQEEDEQRQAMRHSLTQQIKSARRKIAAWMRGEEPDEESRAIYASLPRRLADLSFGELADLLAKCEALGAAATASDNLETPSRRTNLSDDEDKTVRSYSTDKDHKSFCKRAEKQCETNDQHSEPNQNTTRMDLDLLMKVLPKDASDFLPPSAGWYELHDLAFQLVGAEGIPIQEWQDACAAIGRDRASALAIILAAKGHAFGDRSIRTPYAWFRAMRKRATTPGMVNLHGSLIGLLHGQATV